MFKVGDLITAIPDNPYSYTNENMLVGKVVRVMYDWTKEKEEAYTGQYKFESHEYEDADIVVLIVKHKTHKKQEGSYFPVGSCYFRKLKLNNKKEFKI